MYRGGQLGKSAGPEGQFWATEHPSTPGYASKYGVPPENTPFDFVETGTRRPGVPFITRTAPGGDAIEVVFEPDGVELTGFSTLDAVLTIMICFSDG